MSFLQLLIPASHDSDSESCVIIKHSLSVVTDGANRGSNIEWLISTLQNCLFSVILQQNYHHSTIESSSISQPVWRLSVFFLRNGLILRNFRPACLPLALKAATFLVVAYVYRHVLCDVTPSALAFGVPSHQLCATKIYGRPADRRSEETAP